MDITKNRRATAVAQTVLRESTPSLIVDGKPGSFTVTAYQRADSAMRGDIDRLMASMGYPGSVRQLNEEYNSAKGSAVATGNDQSIFDLQVVPALVREARARGVNPIAAVTQVALETGYGKSTPKAEDGSPSYNYGGIKWQSVKTAKKAFARTQEVLGGKAVSLVDAFSVFNSPSEFAQAYFNYLLNGPSSYRYKGLRDAKTPFEYGAILQKGGYATDPRYADKFAKLADSVSRRYDLA